MCMFVYIHMYNVYTLYVHVLVQVVGFMWGYLCQQFAQTIYILGAGCLLAALVS